MSVDKYLILENNQNVCKYHIRKKEFYMQHLKTPVQCQQGNLNDFPIEHFTKWAGVLPKISSLVIG